jgi:hypothetical protein
LAQAGGLSAVLGIINRPEDARQPGGGPVSGVAAQRPLDQLLQTLTLANELLPPLPLSPRFASLVDTAGGATQAAQDLFGKQPSAGHLEQFAVSNAALLLDYGAQLLPVLVEISVTILNDAIRHAIQADPMMCKLKHAHQAILAHSLVCLLHPKALLKGTPLLPRTGEGINHLFTRFKGSPRCQL